jgi:transitional endoplasmic reticulum ATPase
MTEGYTGADLAALVREAAMIALREDINATVVSRRHFEEAMKKVRPSVTKQMLEYYRRWLEEARQMRRELRTATPALHI